MEFLILSVSNISSYYDNRDCPFKWISFYGYTVGGQKARVVFADIALMDPDILILVLFYYYYYYYLLLLLSFVQLCRTSLQIILILNPLMHWLKLLMIIQEVCIYSIYPPLYCEYPHWDSIPSLLWIPIYCGYHWDSYRPKWFSNPV